MKINKKKMVRILLTLTLVLGTTLFIQHTDVQAKMVKMSGYYYTVVQSKKPSYSNIYMKKAKIKGNKITTTGSFSFGKSDIGSSGKKLKAKKRTFVLSKKCKFYNAWGVPGGPYKFTKNKALKSIRENLSYEESPTCCSFLVKNGKVIKVMLGQA